jgi:O-antigen/teichoic acid export membrane protein
MSEVRRTALYAVIYTVGVVLNRVISIIMLPIYTRCLTPRDYGTLELLTMTTDVFGMLAGLGLTAAVFRYYYKYETEAERNMVISTVTMLLMVFYFVASSIGFLSSDVLASLILEGGKEDKFYFQLMFAIFFIQSFIEIPLTFIKAQQRPYFFVLVNAGKLLLQLSLNIYFVVILKMEILGVLYSTLISSLVFGIGLVIYTFKTVGFSFNRGFARTVILFGAPFIITNISDFLLTFSDRYFLKSFTNLSVVGIYSLGYKMGFIFFSLAVAPFFNVWGPQRFEIASKSNALAVNQQVFFLFNLVIISFALGISLFSHDLFRIMSAREFWSAYKVVPLIMVAYIIQAWTAFVNFGILYREETKYMAYGAVVAAVSVIVLSFLLIPSFTAYGAAIATILAFFVRFIIINVYSQRLYQLPLQWGRIIMMLAIAALVNIVSLYFRHNEIVVSIAMNCGLFVLFFLLLIISPVFTLNERRMVISLVLHPIRTYKTKVIAYESVS